MLRVKKLEPAHPLNPIQKGFRHIGKDFRIHHPVIQKRDLAALVTQRDLLVHPWNINNQIRLLAQHIIPPLADMHNHIIHMRLRNARQTAQRIHQIDKLGNEMRRHIFALRINPRHQRALITFHIHIIAVENGRARILHNTQNIRQRETLEISIKLIQRISQNRIGRACIIDPGLTGKNDLQRFKIQITTHITHPAMRLREILN